MVPVKKHSCYQKIVTIREKSDVGTCAHNSTFVMFFSNSYVLNPPCLSFLVECISSLYGSYLSNWWRVCRCALQALSFLKKSNASLRRTRIWLLGTPNDLKCFTPNRLPLVFNPLLMNKSRAVSSEEEKLHRKMCQQQMFCCPDQTSGSFLYAETGLHESSIDYSKSSFETSIVTLVFDKDLLLYGHRKQLLSFENIWPAAKPRSLKSIACSTELRKRILLRVNIFEQNSTVFKCASSSNSVWKTKPLYGPARCSQSFQIWCFQYRKNNHRPRTRN